MRPSLRTITEHSRPRRPRARRATPRKRSTGEIASERQSAGTAPQSARNWPSDSTAGTPLPAAGPASLPLPQGASRSDPAVQRVRAEGGPLDCAYYNCQCGYLFNAPVTTTVECPNCATHQAW
jgi:hypothetical protein